MSHIIAKGQALATCKGIRGEGETVEPADLVPRRLREDPKAVQAAAKRHAGFVKSGTLIVKGTAEPEPEIVEPLAAVTPTVTPAPKPAAAAAAKGGAKKAS